MHSCTHEIQKTDSQYSDIQIYFCCKVTRLRGFHIDIEALSHPGIADGRDSPKTLDQQPRQLDSSLSTGIIAGTPSYI